MEIVIHSHHAEVSEYMRKRAVRAVECVVAEGIEAAMNRFNPLASEA